MLLKSFKECNEKVTLHNFLNSDFLLSVISRIMYSESCCEKVLTFQFVSRGQSSIQLEQNFQQKIISVYLPIIIPYKSAE